MTGKEQSAPKLGDDVEQDTELQRRLRALAWPTPPTGARERGLDALQPYLEQLAENGRNGHDHEEPDSDA